MAIIESKLMKTSYLFGNSGVFPMLVKAACWRLGIEFTDEILQYAASQDTILNALDVDDEGDIDEPIRALLASSPAAVDTAIVTVVTEWKDLQGGS